MQWNSTSCGGGRYSGARSSDLFVRIRSHGGRTLLNRLERNEMVIQHLPLVGYLVSDLCSKASHLSRDDLASAGAVALITSADSFNPDLGVPFGAFARRRILGAFADEMRASDWATRSARRRIKETMSVQETLGAALGRAPSVEEIASALGVEQSVVEAALADASRTLTPLDEAVIDTLAAETLTPEHSILADERLQYLRSAVKSLPERMRYVVEEIYFGDRTVKELAAELGSTHAAVSQQRSEAIRLLRDGLTVHYADDPDQHVEVQSRITPRRRSDYLAQLAESTAGGITRSVFPLRSALNEAV